MIERHAKLATRRGIEHIRRWINVGLIGRRGNLGPVGVGSDQERKVRLIEAKLDRFVVEDRSIRVRQSSLGSSEPNKLLEPLEPGVALGSTRRGELGVIRRAHDRIT